MLASCTGTADPSPAGSIATTSTPVVTTAVVPGDPTITRGVTDASYRIRLAIPTSWDSLATGTGVVAAPDVAAWTAPPAGAQVTGVEIGIVDLEAGSTAAAERDRVHAARPTPEGCGPPERSDVTWDRFGGVADRFECDDGRSVTLATVSDDDPTRLVVATSVAVSEADATATAAILDTIAVGPARPADGFRTDATGRIGVVFPAGWSWRFFSEVDTVATTNDVGSWTAGYGGGGSGAADAAGFVVTLTDLDTPATADELTPLIGQTLDGLFVPPSDCAPTGRTAIAGVVLVGLADTFECDNGFSGRVGLAFDPDVPTFVVTVVVVIDPTDSEGSRVIEDAVASVIVVDP